jgi:hypothetical protein
MQEKNASRRTVKPMAPMARMFAEYGSLPSDMK